MEYKCLDMLNFVPFVHIDEIITGYKFWWLKILNNFFRLQTDRPYIIESNIFIPKGHGIVPSDLFHVFFRVLYYKSLYICIYYRQSLRLGELELSLEFNLMQLSVEDFKNKIQVNSPAPDCCHWLELLKITGSWKRALSLFSCALKKQMMLSLKFKLTPLSLHAAGLWSMACTFVLSLILRKLWLTRDVFSYAFDSVNKLQLELPATTRGKKSSDD